MVGIGRTWNSWERSKKMMIGGLDGLSFEGYFEGWVREGLSGKRGVGQGDSTSCK